MWQAVLGTIGTALAGKLANKAFGGGGPSKTLRGAQPVQNIQTPGLSFGATLGGLDVRRKKPLLDAFAELREAGGALGGGLDQLIARVRPGFGELTKSRVGAIQDAARKATGDVRANLSRRRLGGSSFASDAVGRVASEFGKQEAQVRAESLLEEMALTTELITEKYNLAAGIIEAEINQSQFEATAATNFASGVSSAIANNAANLATIQRANIAGLGGTFGPAIKDVFDKIFGSTASTFGSTASTFGKSTSAFGKSTSATPMAFSA